MMPSRQPTTEPAALVIERHFDPEDQAADPYPLIPFDLPPGVTCLEVRYTYSDPISPDPLEAQPGNVVDLGVLAPDGFRGWSGSARLSFTLTPEWATPGYLPGLLPAGRWHVLLGLYKLAPAVKSHLRKLWADGGYAGQLIAWVHEHLDAVLEIVERDPNQKGFKLLPRRWVVERTLAWLNRYRRLSKDYEHDPRSSETVVYVASIRTMLRRLTA